MKKGAVCAAVILAALLAGAVLAAPFVNDLTAKQTAEGLRALPLPEDTRLVETAYAAGKLTGNGNGMQYFGAVLLQSGLSLAELEAHYADCAQHDWECCVEPQADSAIRAVEHGSLRLDTSVSGEGYYIVYSWGSGLPFFQEFDLRGH